MTKLEWLTARPVAHRGLHDTAEGVIENTPQAFRAAIEGGYAIECDVQLSGDGEAMVFHDATLERLTLEQGALRARRADELKAVRFKHTTDRMIALSDLCALVAGRVPLIVEIKSDFSGHTRLAARTAEILQGYAGKAAAMSFDPAMVSALRERAPSLTRGLVAENPARNEAVRARVFRYLRAALQAEPDFLAWSVNDLPSAPPCIVRFAPGKPLLTWTVRTKEQRSLAARYASQMIFESFRP